MLGVSTSHGVRKGLAASLCQGSDILSKIDGPDEVAELTLIIAERTLPLRVSQDPGCRISGVPDLFVSMSDVSISGA